MTVNDFHPAATAAPAGSGLPQQEAPGALADIVSSRLVDLVSMAADASHYALRPEKVATPRDAGEVGDLVAWARAAGKSITYRSGGTSLSGQSVSDSVLVDVRKHFRQVEVLDGGRRVRCGPGATIRNVNARLLRHRRMLGPDPASEIACTIGGMVANNSSGMACGTERNTYNTLESMVLVLPSGTVVDTGAAGADDRLRADEPRLWRGLAALRDRVRGNPESVRTLRHQFSMKNTMGYGLNSFLDFDQPVKILEHLAVGSEGTLGFIAEATLATVEMLPHAATALLLTEDVSRATDALPLLLQQQARTIELLDAGSLKVVQHYPQASDELRKLQIDRHTALLVELQGHDADTVAGQVADLSRAAAGIGISADFTTESGARANLWHLRKGLYASVASARPAGTVNLLEDVVVPVPELTATTAELAALFTRYGYRDSVIFGHAKDGNLHFMITPDLADGAALQTYAEFTEDLVEVVLGHHGSLKAEHGTGRIMAPFVARQYGDELFSVMREVKELVDPEQLLNPGVLLTDDPRAHLKHIKDVEPVADRVDSCVECGFCEPTCPSADLTTTPRRRIALLRAAKVAPPAEAKQLLADYDYEAVDTCAADSLCATACPVSIDTGKFMKEFRAERHSGLTQAAGVQAARHWGGAVNLLRGGLRVAEVVPDPVLTRAAEVARAILPKDWVPQPGSNLPGPGQKFGAACAPAAVTTGDPVAVFFSSCMGNLFDSRAAGALLSLCHKARVPIVEIGERLCCATPWVSKGLTDGAAVMAGRVVDELWKATRQGELPVISDASSCTHGLQGLAEHLTGERAERASRLRVVDAVTFAAEHLLSRLEVDRIDSVMLHPTCSTVHLDAGGDLTAVAAAMADEVLTPDDWGCCGFAGDRGMLHPELTRAATAREAAEVTGRPATAYASHNRTCELGMQRATGEDYRHILQLLDDASVGTASAG